MGARMLHRLLAITQSERDFSCLAVLTVAALFSVAPKAEAQQVSAERLTCNYIGYPSAFVLDASDFAAIKKAHEEDPHEYDGPAPTSQYFVTLRSDSAERKQICDTRGIWRAIVAGKATNDDFIKTYPRWIVSFLSTSEQEKIVSYQINVLATDMSH